MMVSAGPFQTILDSHRPPMQAYETTYKHLHANPELSNEEHRTAELIAHKLKELSADLDIHSGIGGTGLIAILRNGLGKTVLLRADMDALPVLENTGLQYASKKEMRDSDGIMQPVMHACGHDVHITALLGAIETLLSCRESWSGTLVFLFQPAEEKASGALAMVDDGLYQRLDCPTPDILLGQHVYPMPAGQVTMRSGPAMCASDGLRVTVYGRGGHASTPHRIIDPVVVASSIVMRLQTIVSREIPPGEVVVLSVGAINAGMTENIISDHAILKINIRTASSIWRERVLASIRRIVKAECDASACPKPALVENISYAPLTFNDGEVTQALSQTFARQFGESYKPDMDLVFGSEDFSNLSKSINKPYCFWFFGGHSEEMWQKYMQDGRLDEIPFNHSPLFAPVIQPTLQTGVDAMVIGALTFTYKNEAQE